MLDDEPFAYDDGLGDSEDDAIEIVDLPPGGLDKRVERVQAVGVHLWSSLRRPRLFSLPMMLACLLLLTLLSGSQLYRQVARPAGQTRLQYVSAEVILPGGPIIWSSHGIGTDRTGIRLMPQPGPLPAGCPQGAEIDNLGTIGDYPVWVKGFVGPYAHLPLLPQNVAADPWLGWDIPLQVFMMAGFHTTPTLSFSSLTNGLPPFFSNEDDGYGRGTTYSNSKTLDITEATQSTPYPGKHIYTWNLLVHIIHSGCYRLDVDWIGGHWLIVFTAS
jgi:hypothetical protein